MKKDQELIRLQGLVSLFKDLESRLLSLQQQHGVSAKKRVCAYLTNRYGFLLEWIKEV